VSIIVASNQAGIALGIFSREQMSAFNAALRTQVERSGGRIDAFYFCPHLEPKNLKPGEKPCECSKPAPGMLREAEQDFGINLSMSFVIGDKSSDVTAGQAVGCVSILVETGKAGREDGALSVRPALKVQDLREAAHAVENYIGREPRLDDSVISSIYPKNVKNFPG